VFWKSAENRRYSFTYENFKTSKYQQEGMATRLAVCCFKSPLTAPPRAFCIATHSLFPVFSVATP